jgi:tryptophan synthase beta chain
MAPMVSHVVDLGLITAQAVEQREAFDAGLLFARTEGLVPAPESCHAVAGAIAEARRRADTGEAGVLVVGLSGNGQLDLPAYAEHLTGARTPATGDQPF